MNFTKIPRPGENMSTLPLLAFLLTCHQAWRQPMTEGFQPKDAAREAMQSANRGDGLASEFNEIRSHLSTADQSKVIKEMQKLAGTPGYENVHFMKDGSIVFNADGANIGNNETKWKYSSDTKSLLPSSEHAQAPDQVNVLAGKLSVRGNGGVEKTQPPGRDSSPVSSQESGRKPESEKTPTERLLGEGLSEDFYRGLALDKGRPDMLTKSKDIAGKILGGDDVHDYFKDESPSNQRLLWQLTKAELSKHVTTGTELDISKQSDGGRSIMLKGMDNGANILISESLGSTPRDITVNDSKGFGGTGWLGTSFMAGSKDAFITPQDRAQTAAEREQASVARSKAFFDAIKGESWDRDIQSMQNQIREASEDPAKMEELREKFQKNSKVKIYDAKARGE